MSISVDDLVASFSANHIGQEAMDLAALQAQLAHTFCQTLSNARNVSRRGSTQPSNTPIMRTPSSSISWDPSDANVPWGRPSSVSAAAAAANTQWSRSIDTREREADDLDEERMVEDLLIPSPSTSSAPHYPFFHPSSPVSASAGTAAPTMGMTSMSAYDETFPLDLPSPNTSLFASTDPFFIAQLQQMAAPPPPSNSFFAQTGRPSQHSPFVAASPKSAFGHPYGFHGAMSADVVDPHTVLVASTGC